MQVPNISKHVYILLQEERVLNFTIPCEVLLTLLLTSERWGKENSVHVCGNREKG
jgi:hypothetical protein